MKYSLQAVKDAFVSINKVSNDKGTAKWAYGLAKNKGFMKSEIDGIIAVEGRIISMERKFVDYCKEHAKKDEKGNPLVDKGSYVGIDYENDKALKDIVEERQKEIDALNSLLKDEVEMNFHRIDFEEVPEKIAPVDFEKLSIFINEPKK